ncbi:hypothetical protein O9G_001740 [Rozella allomycis CSF55]|uniref:Uncharacterized protein n=1 Tax=Rozella allomycis (strain CSF55) TaxID=988480 RepID=A0A075AST5_ROZAC|nr:hypothetical protein O9G_001740 [Rozella allomycis CSF55]|eukprot:EPZ33328.1 hypothetical protein O9G_001740 [Rozella allomycis CSF55]
MTALAITDLSLGRLARLASVSAEAFENYREAFEKIIVYSNNDCKACLVVEFIYIIIELSLVVNSNIT